MRSLMRPMHEKLGNEFNGKLYGSIYLVASARLRARLSDRLYSRVHDSLCYMRDVLRNGFEDRLHEEASEL